MQTYPSLMINQPKTSFFNTPLLIALLITSLIHFLLIAELKIEPPETAKKTKALEITLIKPSHIQSLVEPVVPMTPVTPVMPIVPEQPMATETPVKKINHSQQPKKTAKSHHRVVKTAPHIAKTSTKKVDAQTVLTEPATEVDPVTSVESAPVVPATPEPQLEATAPETVNVTEQVNLPQPEIIENRSVDLPVTPRKKSGKKSKKIARHSSGIKKSPTPLSLDDLAAQITQVGEKFGNQTVSSSESRIKTLETVSKHKVSARQYKQDWRQKIERIANLNYPEVARQKDFSARLVIEVGINADGSLHSLRIKKSSGTATLDAAVKNIVQMGAPFGALPGDLAEELDVLIFQQPMSFSDESGATAQ